MRPTQGSSFLATLGLRTQSRWDWKCVYGTGRAATLHKSQIKNQKSISIVVRLIGAVRSDPEIVRLFFREPGQFDSDFFKVQPGYFLIELLGQTIDVDFVGFPVLPEVHLGQDLIGKGVRHDKA